MTKKKHQSIVSLPKVVTIITFTLVAILTVDFGRKALENYQIQRQVEWSRDLVDIERETNAELQEELEWVGSDAYVQEIASRRLKMVKPGEVAVVVIPASTQQSSLPSTTMATEVADDQAKPYWQRWASLLLGSDD